VDTTGIISIVVSVVVGIASLGLGYYIYLRSQRKMELQVVVFKPWSPVEIRDDVGEKIKVYYRYGDEDKLVTDIFLVQIRVKNSGNLSIRGDDADKVKKPLTCTFNEGTIIMGWTVVDNEQTKWTLDISQGKNELRCYFDLLNEGEGATLQIACYGQDKHQPKLSSHIDGVKVEEFKFESFAELRVKAKESKSDIVLGCFFVILAICWFVFMFPPDTTSISDDVFYVVLGAIIATVGAWAINSGYRKYKHRRLL
jgi:hypothetical protein